MVSDKAMLDLTATCVASYINNNRHAYTMLILGSTGGIRFTPCKWGN